ncbi:hypothetical protein SKAU_G00213860 [Synaphobranchus kaupii]|uniref:Uncharacterized protein n=1 Tax=Synaphobranchus kaupii TaxID=118154 RepID=A0A9Q1F9F5_SYNKA|nr:hypothetical protein SKAU_G00213860 [Synaphobranchus kaupii]
MNIQRKPSGRLLTRNSTVLTEGAGLWAVTKAGINMGNLQWWDLVSDRAAADIAQLLTLIVEASVLRGCSSPALKVSRSLGPSIQAALSCLVRMMSLPKQASSGSSPRVYKGKRSRPGSLKTESAAPSEFHMALHSSGEPSTGLVTQAEQGLLWERSCQQDSEGVP